MLLRKVVVTGFGAVSPFGIGAESLIDNLSAGHSAVVSMKSQWQESITDLNCWIGAPVKETLPVKTINRRYRKTMGRTAMMAFLAAKEAAGMAAIPENAYSSGRTGISFSSTVGSSESLIEYVGEYVKSSSLKGVPSGAFFRGMSHTCAANISHALGICGRVISPDAACSSSTQAIGLAYETIKNGKQDIMLCGGADDLNALVCGSFDLINATSSRFNDRPTLTPRPFDSNRDGTVCGEGAGCIVLESESSAKKRGTPILAEVIGFSTSADGSHLAQPHSDSIMRSIKAALDDAKVEPDEVDYINAHATGTVLGDIAESEAITNVFGKKKVPVSSLKGHMGHTLGASGALELIVSISMMGKSELLPTLNLDNPGEGCDNLLHITCKKKRNINLLVKNSFAFGGINAVLVLRRYNN